MYVTILDNTVLSNFARTDNMTLLRSLIGGSSYTTSEIIVEINDGVATIPSLNSVNVAVSGGWIEEYTLSSAASLASLSQIQNTYPSIGIGEASCLVAAKIFGKAVVATDDRYAQNCISREGVGVIDTVSLLVDAVTSSLVTIIRAEEIMDDMRRESFLTPVVLANVI